MNPETDPAHEVPLPEPAGALDLASVVTSHGWVQTPPFRWDAATGTLTRVERLHDGVATVAVRQRDGRLESHADRPLDTRAAGQAAAQVARVLQLDADMAGFHEAAGFDPALADALRSRGAGRILAGASLWEDVVKTVSATNTTWRQAVTVMTRIAAWDPEGAFPGPEAVAERGEGVLRREVRAGYRARSLARAAAMGAGGDLDALDAAAADLPPRELLRELRAIPGVGPTRATLLAFMRGRFDTGVPIDSALRAAASERWGDGETLDDAAIRAAVAPAGEWGGLALYWATMLRWREGVTAPD